MRSSLTTSREDVKEFLRTSPLIGLGDRFGELFGDLDFKGSTERFRRRLGVDDSSTSFGRGTGDFDFGLDLLSSPAEEG